MPGFTAVSGLGLASKETRHVDIGVASFRVTQVDDETVVVAKKKPKFTGLPGEKPAMRQAAETVTGCRVAEESQAPIGWLFLKMDCTGKTAQK